MGLGVPSVAMGWVVRCGPGRSPDGVVAMPSDSGRGRGARRDRCRLGRRRRRARGGGDAGARRAAGGAEAAGAVAAGRRRVPGGAVVGGAGRRTACRSPDEESESRASSTRLRLSRPATTPTPAAMARKVPGRRRAKLRASSSRLPGSRGVEPLRRVVGASGRRPRRGPWPSRRSRRHRPSGRAGRRARAGRSRRGSAGSTPGREVRAGLAPQLAHLVLGLAGDLLGLLPGGRGDVLGRLLGLVPHGARSVRGSLRSGRLGLHDCPVLSGGRRRSTARVEGSTRVRSGETLSAARLDTGRRAVARPGVSRRRAGRPPSAATAGWRGCRCRPPRSRRRRACGWSPGWRPGARRTPARG